MCYKATSNIPPLEKNGELYTTNLEKAQLFAEHFKKAFARDDSAQVVIQ